MARGAAARVTYHGESQSDLCVALIVAIYSPPRCSSGRRKSP